MVIEVYGLLFVRGGRAVKAVSFYLCPFLQKIFFVIVLWYVSFLSL